MLDPKLDPIALYKVASDYMNLTDDLVEEIRFHPSAYLDLREWAAYVTAYGLYSVAAPAPPDDAVEESKELTDKEKKTKRLKISVVGAVTLVVAATATAWTFLGSAVVPGEADSDAMKDKAVEAAQSITTSLAATMTGSQPLLRAGNGSMICASTGVGVRCGGGYETPAQMVTIGGLEEAQILALGVGEGVGVAADATGTIYAWGDTSKSELGLSDAESPHEAVVVGEVSGRPRQVVVGLRHACVLSQARIFCFGDNSQGQVDGIPSAAPKKLTELDGLEGVREIATSGLETWALIDDEIWGWGYSLPEGEAAPRALPPTLLETQEQSGE